MKLRSLKKFLSVSELAHQGGTDDGNGSADTLTLTLHKGRGVVHQPPAAHAFRPSL
jgi:hypothetical protein